MRTWRPLRVPLTIVIAIVCVVDSSAAADASEREPCFRIFDATAFRGKKPDLSAYGIEQAGLVYTAHYFWPKQLGLDSLPPKTQVSATVRKELTSKPRLPAVVILDLEHWPNVAEDAVVASSVTKYITLFNWVKEDIPAVPVGYYLFPPLREYWRAVKEPSSAPYRQWQADNDRLRKLADRVDVLLPSLYTFYDHVAGWEAYAAANVREARRLANGKPVYPFIWPRYHDSNKKLSGQPIPKDFWMVQLKTMERIADGVVLWAAVEPWDDDADWWHATQEFIRNSTRVCKGTLPKSPVLESIPSKD